jgi:hypothetical protein
MKHHLICSLIAMDFVASTVAGQSFTVALAPLATARRQIADFLRSRGGHSNPFPDEVPR